MREKIYKIINTDESKYSGIYDIAMVVVIIVSLIPLAFRSTGTIFTVIDTICVIIFIVDYALRLITADYKYGKKGITSFVKYPFSAMAIIDLLSILPSLTVLNSGFKVLRLTRMIKAFKVFRVFKAFRYSKNLKIFVNVAKASKDSLILVGVFALSYMLVTALVMYNVEPENFNTYFDALYWATTALTTVGYGDIYPLTMVGRAFSMISSLVGIAIIALPSGIITAGYINEINKSSED